jgi:hypothetical protein
MNSDDRPEEIRANVICKTASFVTLGSYNIIGSIPPEKF